MLIFRTGKPKRWYGYIYFLRDPRDMRVRYVGETRRPGKRYRCHLSSTAKIPVSQWVRELKAEGIEPIMEVVEMVQASEIEREYHWMVTLSEHGADLLNVDRAKPTHITSSYLRMDHVLTEVDIALAVYGLPLQAQTAEEGKEENAQAH